MYIVRLAHFRSARQFFEATAAPVAIEIDNHSSTKVVDVLLQSTVDNTYMLHKKKKNMRYAVCNQSRLAYTHIER